MKKTEETERLFTVIEGLVDSFSAKMQEDLKQFKGDNEFLKSHLAYGIIMEAVIWTADNHYEGVGLLEEIKLEYREVSLKILAEDAED